MTLRIAAQRLAGYLHETVGSHLRSINLYDEGGVDVIFRREGLRDEYTDEQVIALVTAARDLNGTLHSTNIEETPMGTPEAGVYAFSEAFVVQLPYTPTSGIVFTMDSGAGTTLGTFLHECHHQLMVDE